MIGPRARSLSAALAFLLLVSGVACQKKKVQTVASEESPVIATTAPAPAPDPTPAAAAEPSDPWSGDLETVNRLAREQGLLGDVHFEYDQAELTAEARERLAKNAEFLKRFPQFVVMVEGHCDERGTGEYNLALGQARAASTAGYLGALGLAEGRLKTISYGKERPQCTDSAESCWWRNRRAHFVVVDRRG